MHNRVLVGEEENLFFMQHNRKLREYVDFRFLECPPPPPHTHTPMNVDCHCIIQKIENAGTLKM